MTEEKEWLEKGDEIDLPAAGKSIALPLGFLDITKVESTTISVTFRYAEDGVEKTIRCEGHDLFENPLTIGKLDPAKPKTLEVPAPAPDGDATLKTKYSNMSRLQATIYNDERGFLKYRHEGSNKIRNPNFINPVPEMLGPIAAEDGTGGGYTHENRNVGNVRTSNEDRGLAQRALPLKDGAAISYLQQTISNFIAPETHTMLGGSTLSVAMRTRDNHFACSFLGDSPIFMVIQNDATGDIELRQMGIPHNGFGRQIREEFAKFDWLPPLPFQDAWDFISANAPELAARANSQDTDIVGINRHLGQMSETPISHDVDSPESMLINPKNYCPRGYSFKGLLVCSDGVDNAVENGQVQKALTTLFAQHANPTPQAISEAVVMAAKPYTNDNITAMMLPAKGKPGDLIAVADGNAGTADVAETAITILREHCQYKFVPLTVKKDGQYRISLQGNLVKPEEARQWLGTLADNFRALDPEHSHQMGMHIVRETLVIKNPTNEARKHLESIIRSQDQLPDRGRL